jgi:hypothetical protein
MNDAPGFMPGTGFKKMRANMPACMGRREGRKKKSIKSSWKFLKAWRSEKAYDRWRSRIFLNLRTPLNLGGINRVTFSFGCLGFGQTRFNQLPDGLRARIDPVFKAVVVNARYEIAFKCN